jgi:hypothetical protein
VGIGVVFPSVVAVLGHEQMRRELASLKIANRPPSSLMKTEAVICMAFTRQRPSQTPLSRTHSSTSRVILTNPLREGMLNQSSLR